MKWTRDLRFTAIATAALSTMPVFASFEPLPIGGRAAGMGEAYSAVADDVYTLYYNPAGVVQMTRPEFGSYYSQLYPGLTDNSQITRGFLGYAQPIGKEGRKGSLGVAYTALELPGLYKEESMGVTYGREYKRLWNIGGTVKLLRKSIGSDDYTDNAIDPLTGASTNEADPLLAKSHSASALGFDLGAQYRFARAYALGFTMRNLNQPDLGLADQKDSAPAIFGASIARKMRTGSLDLEFQNWSTTSSNYRIALGGETWIKYRFGLRGGGAFGSRNYASLSVGASYRMDMIQVDYAMMYPLQGIQGTMGIQQVSLTLRLGKPPVDPLEKQLIKEKEERIRAETEARNAKAERDRLKKQLFSLTEAKTQAEQEAERRAAQRALQDAQQLELRAAQQRTDPRPAAQTRTLYNAYTQALTDYNTKVNQGIGLAAKRQILEKIYNDFNGKGVDLATVTRELKSLKVDELKAKKDLELSMSFYRRLAQQGVSKEERRGMLERIIQKYKDSGIDTTAAEEELKALK